MARKLSKAFLKLLETVKGKRSLTVVQHILKHGHITTEQLKNTYGYDHPPRAVRDVREQGIPIETFRIADSRGRRIAAYRFADPTTVRGGRLAGRSVLSKKFKDVLIARYGSRCAVCSCVYENRYFQIDHRVPYQVTGDIPGNPNPADFMLICGSCNRAKSWSCEHCPNWTTEHDPRICKTCYWANPEIYTHIALRRIRRLDLVWAETEVPSYDKLLRLSKQAKQPLPNFVKDVLRRNANELS